MAFFLITYLVLWESFPPFDKSDLFDLEWRGSRQRSKKSPRVQNIIAEYAKSRFREIQDVKYATTRPEANLVFRSHEPDVVVETWMNSWLYVYVLDHAPKSRTIKSILKQNTGASIGTLFLVDAELLPNDGYVGRVSAWQDDLRVMNMGAIYAYELADDAIRLIQVNYDETTLRNQFIVWHTTEFPCDAVSVRRRDFQSNIRGSWYIGDIASPRFKRRIDEERARQRFHYQTKRRQEIDGLPAQQISAAYLALEIEVGAGQEAVKEAFRKLAREYHPDVTAHEKGEAERRFKEVQSAYDQIKSHRRWR